MEGIDIQKIFITAELEKDNAGDQQKGNTDVIVFLSDGHKYTASFFSYDFIEQIRRRNELSGDFLGGKYFWGKNMVLVEKCTTDVISPVIKDIIDEGEFKEIFRPL